MWRAVKPVLNGTEVYGCLPKIFLKYSQSEMMIVTNIIDQPGQ